MNVTMSLYDFFAYARRQAGMTQAQLAKKAGVSRNYIGMIEHGGANVTYSTLVKVAGALGYKMTVNLYPKEGDETK